MKKILSLILLINLLSKIYCELNKNESDLYIKAYFKYLEGLNYENKNKITEAMELYKNSIKIYKFFPEPYYRIALLCYKKNEFRYSELYINKAKKYEDKFKNKSDYIKYLWLGGEIFYTTGNYDKALNYLVEYTNYNKNDIELFYKIGEIYYTKNNFEASKDNLEKYVNIVKNKNLIKREEINFLNSLKMLVNIYSETKDYKKEMEYLKIIYVYFPTKEIKEKISILSNNLRYYDEK